MKNMFVKNILTLSVLTAVVVPTVYAEDIPFKAGIQRSFLNMNFEIEPDFMLRNQNDYGCYAPTANKNEKNKGTSWPSSYCVFPHSDELYYGKNSLTDIGWKTTNDPGLSAAWKGRREIELWKAGTGVDSANEGMAVSTSSGGSIYAELNSHQSAALYQNLCVSNQDQFTWSLDHAKRADTNERMSFFMTSQIGNLVTGKLSNDEKLLILTDDTGKSVFGAGVDTQTWVTYKKTSYQSLENVPNIDLSKPKTVSFAFQAEAASSTSANEDRGNWLDNIRLKFKPAVEFSAKNDDFLENHGKTQPIKFKMVGLIESQMDVPTLDFQILYEQKVPLGERLIYGTDYVIHKRVNGEYVPLGENEIVVDRASRGIKFSYTPELVQGLDYAQGVEIDGLAIELIDNPNIHGNKTLPISFNLNQDSKAVAMSLSSCGGEPTQKFQLNVIDDDVDLAVSKNIIHQGLSDNTKDMRASYEIEVSNVGQSTVNKFLVKDQLFANLAWDAATTLSCSSESEHFVCPTNLDNTSLEKLFNPDKGLEFSELLGDSKFKLTITDLKLQKSSESKIINQVEVVLLDSVIDDGKIIKQNEVNIDNNKAEVESFYPYLTDLSNKVDGSVDETGVGLFHISKGGRNGTVALLTKPSDAEKKVYFPLNINNEAVYQQTYNLHVSGSRIEPENSSDYSGLNKSTINALPSGMRIRFFDVEEAQCKTGLSSGDVSQITVAAGERNKQICAEITLSDTTETEIPIWFAIESVETGLGDIIHNAVTVKKVVQRLLELVNDQQAQINVGGTYVFAHRLTNNGSIAETGLSLAVKPLLEQDDFSYTLFIDHNNNGILDTGDEQVQPTTVAPNLPVGESMSLLLKVQAPATATNGMRGQAEIIVTPTKILEDILLEALTNLDTVFVGSNQLTLQKMQFKQENCTDISAEQIKAANFTLSQMSIGRHDCIIYRIQATNIGAEPLTSIVINDVYPAYTTPWTSLNNTLPMTDSGDSVTTQSDKVETKIAELKPGEKKSLYFGIKLQ